MGESSAVGDAPRGVTPQLSAASARPVLWSGFQEVMGKRSRWFTYIVPLYPLIFQCVFPKSTGIRLHNYRQLHLTQEFNTDTELQGQWSLVHSPFPLALPLLGKNNDIHLLNASL